MRKLPFIFLSLAIATCFSSCIFRSALDEHGKVKVRTPNKLTRLYGERKFEKIKKQRKVSRDPKYTEPVNRVSKHLKKVIDIPENEWEFVVFKDASANAFALPGGKVGINTGLFGIADSDALLAAVLGHEISHATAGHSSQRMIHAAAVLITGAILYQVVENNRSDSGEYSLAAYALATYLLETLPLSRRQEYESDRIGAIYMAQAGYDPRESLELWKRLSVHHLSHGNKKPDFLRTHPPNEKRISSLRAFMPVAMKYYRNQAKRE